MREEDFVEVTWDQCGNLLLRQGRGSGGDHELQSVANTSRVSWKQSTRSAN